MHTGWHSIAPRDPKPREVFRHVLAIGCPDILRVVELHIEPEEKHRSSKTHADSRAVTADGMQTHKTLVAASEDVQIFAVVLLPAGTDHLLTTCPAKFIT